MAFDRSPLPPALLEFAILADTHYMVDPGERPLEFESRRQQTARAGFAMRQVASLAPAFVVHLGDLVQEYPGTADFDRAVDEALAQVDECGLRSVRYVAGNHDVGDKPDPTMPTAAVDASSLAAFEERFGRSWYSFECELDSPEGDGGPAPRRLVCVILNSQILNSDMDAAVRQRQWLEAELAARQGERVLLFMHLPPYLCHPDEPGLGHYDNVAEPARSWLMELIERHWVEMVFAAHVHHSFCDCARGTRYRLAPSTSFTRPGFAHLFASDPPPEGGRDDVARLGFLLCRVREAGTDVHFVRTRGRAGDDDAPARSRGLLTPLPPPRSRGGLALSLCHPLTRLAEVPLAWPSGVRQPVRDDHPLLACGDLGAGAVRVPWTDLVDPVQGPRLSQGRDQGIEIQDTSLWLGAEALADQLDQMSTRVDQVEIQIPGDTMLPPDLISALADPPDGIPMSLCAVVAREVVDGKQHPRTRIGYRPDELADLDRHLGEAGVRVDGVLCRLGAAASPWDDMLQLCDLPGLAHIGHIDLIVQLPHPPCEPSTLLLAEALFAARQGRGARLYVEPLIDLDRTMDLRAGLLDGLCNPRPAYEVARCLNAVLGANGEELTPSCRTRPGLRLLYLEGPSRSLCLLLPEEDAVRAPDEVATELGGEVCVYRLEAASSEPFLAGGLATVPVEGPVLLEACR